MANTNLTKPVILQGFKQPDVYQSRESIEKIEIDQETKQLIIYSVIDNSNLASYPPPPPTYIRKVYAFDKLELVAEEELVTIQREVKE